jgi:ribosomal-protein-alanine N-acetyltransferase
MSGYFRIRTAGPDDAETMARLHGPAFPDAWPVQAFASLLQREGVIALLGGRQQGHDVDGFILIQIAVDEAEVLTFCVAETARRRGLGRLLLQAACEAAKSLNAVRIFLEVGEDNLAARALYEQSGFGTVGRRKAYYSHGANASDALVMRKPLQTTVLSP